MAKLLPTIWPLEEHTRAKHDLPTRYLSRWVPILQHGRGKTGDLRAARAAGIQGPNSRATWSEITVSARSRPSARWAG